MLSSPDCAFSPPCQLPPSVLLIYTYPNLSSCAEVPGLKEALASWPKHKTIPLPPRVSPMQGWVDAVPFVPTKYALLLHNDGYALDPFFTCELVGALEARSEARSSNATEARGGPSGGPFVVAAPMLYESKADGSLAAHATQANLRLVREAGAPTGLVVRHDHSPAKALNRGKDLPEGPQQVPLSKLSPGL